MGLKMKYCVVSYAQFMFRKTCPKNMEMKAILTLLSVMYKATNISGDETKRPMPHITGSTQATFLRSQILRPLPKRRPQTPATHSTTPNRNPTLKNEIIISFFDFLLLKYQNVSKNSIIRIVNNCEFEFLSEKSMIFENF